MAIESNERLAAFGNQLVEVHLWLRDELDRLRDDLDAYLDGGGERPRELRAHCLTFCSALDRHHTGEDGGAFAVLERRFPQLRPVLDELRNDHVLVSDALRRLESLVSGLESEKARPEKARTVRAELDTLAALMETHFVYEEKRIVSALNSLDVPGWHASRPDFLDGPT